MSQTQPQMLWNMAFSKRLNEILTYQNSLTYWKVQFESIPQQTKSEARYAKRLEACEKVTEIGTKLDELTEAFEEWVMQHPYPVETLTGR